MGTENLPDYELIEVILFGALPRGDGLHGHVIIGRNSHTSLRDLS